MWPGGHLAKVAMVCNLVHQQRRMARKHKSLVLESPRTVRGHQISGANVVPGHARRDGPTKTSNRRKMFGVIDKKKIQVGRHVEFQTLVKQFTIIIAIGLTAHLEWFEAVRGRNSFAGSSF